MAWIDILAIIDTLPIITQLKNCQIAHSRFRRDCHYGNMATDKLLRIREILRERGLSSRELADMTQIDPSELSRILTENRRTNTDRLKKIADALELSIAALFRKREIPIVGYIGAGAEFYPIDDHAHGGGIDYIEARTGWGNNAVAVRVRGDSMYPVYMENDVLVYDQKNKDIEDLIGKRCIVKLADGRILLKIIHRGSGPGLSNLLSFNAAPIPDVAIEWAAKILSVEPEE